jgi:hypothetical protein
MKVELCVNHMGTTWELQGNMMRTCLEHIGNIEEKQKKKNMDHGVFFYTMDNAKMLALNWTTEHILTQAKFLKEKCEATFIFF